MRAVLALFVFAATTSAASSASSKSASSPSASSPSPSASGLTSLSNCALACINIAAIDSICVNATNVECVCTDGSFQFLASSCLQGECQPSEAAAALAFQSQQCGTTTTTSGPIVTAVFLPPNSFADLSTATSPAPTSSATSKSPSGSATGKTGGAIPLTGRGVGVAAGVAMLGMVVGGLIVL
ncbi:hypothetical protein B0H11DRAFT_2132214 [Mycena galericulata]|nr:hypothetical protein B0H11DRAFT_2132214 [Mycena galericulata]